MDEHFNPVLHTSPRRTLRERLEAPIAIPTQKDEMNKDQYERLRAIFASIDDDDSGLINREELFSFFEGRKLGNNPYLIEKIFKDMDQDQNNQISLEEFCHAYLSRIESIKKEISAVNKDIENLERSQRHLTDLNEQLHDERARKAQPGQNLLIVRFIQAKLVVDPKEEFNRDFYIYCEIGNQKCKTFTSYNGGAPIWDEKHKFYIFPENVDLKFQLGFSDGRSDNWYGQGGYKYDPRISQVLKEWVPIYSVYNSQIEIGRVEIEFNFVTSEDEYIRAKNNEINLDIKNQKEYIEQLKREQKLYETIFDYIPTNIGTWVNIFKEDKHMRPAQRLTREENLRNMLFYVVAALAILISFHRMDFVTIIIFWRAFNFFQAKWKANYYGMFASALAFSVVYDLAWIFAIAPGNTTESRFVFNVPADATMQTFSYAVTILNLFAKSGLSFYLVFLLTRLYTEGESSSSFAVGESVLKR